MSKRVLSVVGTRPNFVKMAPIVAEIKRRGRFEHLLVHTGQHYDDNMSKVFFDELHIPRPAVNLEVGSGPHGQQTAAMLEKIEQILLSEKPDWVLIYGDTNSTLAGALAAAKLHINVAHVEAGLRSFNRRMPEEINRMVADQLAATLLCPTDLAVKNLAAEGITQGVFQVGDVMYDSVLYNAALAQKGSSVMQTLGLAPKGFYLATIHRAENTDDPARLAGILEAFSRVKCPIVLPLHPRTRKTLGAGLEKLGGPVRVIDPVPYLDMLMLEKNCRMVLTDSGGVQKEAYWFDVPCITLRDQTEWVELVQAGCNVIVGAGADAIMSAVDTFEAAGAKLPPGRPSKLYGDGHCAEKIVQKLLEYRPTYFG